MRRATTHHGNKWHLWSAGGYSACGLVVTRDANPFDPESPDSCKLCVKLIDTQPERHSPMDHIERAELGLAS